MSLIKIFKKVIIPCAAGVTSKGNAEGHTFGPNCVKKAERGTKPSDLPIYSKECVICREANKSTSPPSSMEETVGNIRKELWVWQDSLKGYRHKIVNVYRKSFSKADCPERTNSRNHLENSLNDKINQPPTCPDATKKTGRSLWLSGSKFDKLCVDHCGRPCGGEQKPQNQCRNEPQPPKKCSPEPPCQKPPKKEPSHLCEHKSKPPPSEGSYKKTTIDDLRHPANGSHRIAAITVSGIAGYLLGLRKGRFRRILYGTVGALSMAAVCYPDEATEALEAIVLEGRKYFIIAYHFVYGGEFDDSKESPKIPQWLEKFVGPIGPKEAELQLPSTKENESSSLEKTPDEKVKTV